MLGAITMAMSRAASAMAAFCASEKPVVPITMATPRRRQAARWARVASGRVKSISTRAPRRPASRSAVTGTPEAQPAKAPASWPSAGLSARSSAPASAQSSAARTASISIWPMRPVAPAMATRSGKVEAFIGRSGQVGAAHRRRAGRTHQRAGSSGG